MSIETFWLYAVPILQIVWLDVLLSGDNAMVIALACRNLPPHQRKIGVILGASAAVGLRIVFMFAIVQLLKIPYLKMTGGFLLLYIAVKLVLENNEDADIPARKTLLGVTTTIAFADAAMSLDNVLAVAGVARDHVELMFLGVLLSIPLVMFGAGLMIKLIDRWPILVWAGAALLGWVGGDMIATDPNGDPFIGSIHDIAIKLSCAVLVVAIGFGFRHWRAASKPA